MSFHFLQSHIQPRRQICCKSSFISRTAVSFFQAVFKWFVSSITRQTKKAMSIFSLYFMLLLTPYSLGKHISSINQSMYIVARLASHKKAETCDRRRFPPTSALKNTLGRVLLDFQRCIFSGTQCAPVFDHPRATRVFLKFKGFMIIAVFPKILDAI